MKRSNLAVTILAVGLFAPVAFGQLPVLSGLKMWLRADVGVSTNGTGLITNWADQSGNGYDMSTSFTGDTGYWPKYQANAINGKPAIEFDGFPAGDGKTDTLARDNPDVNTIFPSSQLSMFIVKKQNSHDGDITLQLQFPDDINNRVNFGLDYFGPMYWDQGNVLSGGRISGGMPTDWLGNFHILDFQRAASGAATVSSDNLAFLTGTFTDALDPTAAVRLAMQLGDGSIAELIIYDHALTPTERFAVMSYLSSQYDIELHVPEPATIGLLLIGGGLICWRRRRAAVAVGMVALTASLLTPAAFATYQSQIIANGPQVYWQFEEADGTAYALPTVAAGVQNPPTGNGDWIRYLRSDWASTTKQGGAGAVGGGVAFSYTTSPGPVWYMDTNGGSPSPALGTFNPLDYSVEFLFKPTGDAMRLILDAQGTQSFHGDWTTAGGKPYIGIYQGGTERIDASDVPGPAPTLDRFHHFVFTFEDLQTGTGLTGNSGLAKYYVDGTLLVTKTLTGIPDQANRDPWGALAIRMGLVNGTGGILDELAIYGYALSAEQVLQDYVLTIPEPTTVGLLVLGGWLVWRRMRRV